MSGLNSIMDNSLSALLAAYLSSAEASYQASLFVTSKLFENNLMQYLR